MKRRRSVKSTTASHHWAARSRSASPSQTTSVVQHASPHASGSLVSPPSATVIASSSSATPSSTRPWRTAARPTWASAMHSMSGSAICVRELERRPRVPLGVPRIAGALGVLDRQPAQLRHRSLPAEEAACAGEPSGGLGRAPVDAVLAREVHRHATGAPRVTTALVRRVRLAAALDPGLPLAQPPQRLPEPVERRRIPRVGRERGGVRVARGAPVGLREMPAAALEVFAHGRTVWRPLPSRPHGGASQRVPGLRARRVPEHRDRRAGARDAPSPPRGRRSRTRRARAGTGRTSPRASSSRRSCARRTRACSAAAPRTSR